MIRMHAILLILLLFSAGIHGKEVDAAAAPLPLFDRVRVLQSPREISDADLIDHNGRPFKLSQLRGRVALVFFGFTNCPDVCPSSLQNLRQLVESGGADLADVAFVMISVDGDRDTPDVLKEFLARFSPRFIGLTGAPAAVKKIAADFRAAFFKGNPTGDTYTVSHSPQVFVVDPSGRLRAEFYSASIEAMSAVTLALLNETAPSIKSD